MGKNTFKVWSGTSKKADYHDEMNDQIMHTWLTTAYLPNAPANSVLVLDRATYHTSTNDESKGLKTSWNRDEIADFIVRQEGKDADGVPYTRNRLLGQVYVFQQGGGKTRTQIGLSKDMLVEIAQPLSTPPVMKIKTYFDAYNTQFPHRNLRLLLLPIATPQLNPIEMVWGWIKAECRKNNYNHSMKNLIQMIQDKSTKVSQEQFDNYFQRSMVFLDMQWRADEVVLGKNRQADIAVWENVSEDDAEETFFE
jgi:hypothetical protein